MKSNRTFQLFFPLILIKVCFNIIIMLSKNHIPTIRMSSGCNDLTNTYVSLSAVILTTAPIIKRTGFLQRPLNKCTCKQVIIISQNTPVAQDGQAPAIRSNINNPSHSEIWIYQTHQSVPETGPGKSIRIRKQKEDESRLSIEAWLYVYVTSRNFRRIRYSWKFLWKESF